MVNEQTCVRQNERTAARTLDGKTVVVVLDERQVHALNELGSMIWKLADGRSVAGLVDAVMAEYEVDRDKAVADVVQFVRELVALKVLEVMPS